MRNILIILMLTAVSLMAKPYKSVFDLTSSDPRFLLSRMMLLQTTADMIKANKDEPRFIIVIRGGATPLAVSTADEYIEDEALPTVSKFQEQLKLLHEKYNVEVRVCDIAMDKFGMQKKELLPFMTTTPNSFIDLIGLQNDDFAVLDF